MNIREFTPTDFPHVKAMLADAGLPTEDLVPGHLAFVAEEEGRIVAAIGFQGFDGVGLLRSLVVEEGTRFKGLGREMVSALETHARKQGVHEIWLLTRGVDSYFLALGYVPRDRAEAPAAIRGTAEFAALCPEDATALSKKLG